MAAVWVPIQSELTIRSLDWQIGDISKHWYMPPPQPFKKKLYYNSLQLQVQLVL